MYAFQLGRESKLSLAEIFSVFPHSKIEYADKNICIIDIEKKQDLLKFLDQMWGTIKVIELFQSYRWKPVDTIIEIAREFEGKFRFWLSFLWSDASLKTLLMQAKKMLKEEKISGRFINKNFQNLSSAQIIWEWLVERQSDFTIISAWKLMYFGTTIWVQDIEKYSKRDYGKARDMVVWMLPPKLAQMMINISTSEFVQLKNSTPTIYDPFCGLGTILIESILMQNNVVYGSDISAENIEKTKENLNYARKNFNNSVKTAEAMVLDATWISSSPYLKKSDFIVTEWYLGQVFLKYSVTEKKIDEEKVKLLEMYSKFFEWLSRANYTWVIVISFPFWEVRWKYIYFNEIYELIKKYTKNLPLLPSHEEIKHTRSWSLLYKRPDQIVGREIFKLKMKK